MKALHFVVFLTIISLLSPVSATAKNSIFNLFDLKVAAAVKEGYENNVFLDSSRKGDTFTETDIYAEGAYKLTDRLGMGIEYDFIGLSYADHTDLDLMDNEGCAFLKYYIKDNFTLKAGYVLDSVWYLHDKDGTYFAPGPMAEVRCDITDSTYVKSSYQFRIYDYDKKRINDGAGQTLSTNREDHRHAATFEIGQYIKELLISAEERIDFNDSNDEYMDFYDYTAYKTSIFASMPVFKVLNLVAHGSYRWKDFATRKTADLSATEQQKAMTLGVTAYYNIYKSAYISAGYTYTQNYSNEPANKYSDSVSSAGIHIFF